MMNWNAQQHSYEELRALVIDELLARTSGSFDELQEKVGQAILKRNNQMCLQPTLRLTFLSLAQWVSR